MSLEPMFDFVTHFIEERDPVATKLATRFPFRQLAGHCHRSAVWAGRICDAEGGDRDVAVISALFHDIGKCVDNTTAGHAEAGARICADYLGSVGFDADKSRRIVEIVRTHILHADLPTLEAKIESDADLLDETGAMTVLWDAMAVGAQNEQSYQLAYERILGAWKARSAGDIESFQTPAGRRLFADRLAFLHSFLANLSFELGLPAPPQ